METATLFETDNGPVTAENAKAKVNQFTNKVKIALKRDPSAASGFIAAMEGCKTKPEITKLAEAPRAAAIEAIDAVIALAQSISQEQVAEGVNDDKASAAEWGLAAAFSSLLGFCFVGMGFSIGGVAIPVFAAIGLIVTTGLTFLMNWYGNQIVKSRPRGATATASTGIYLNGEKVGGSTSHDSR